jgi:hypothetical protein
MSAGRSVPKMKGGAATATAAAPMPIMAIANTIDNESPPDRASATSPLAIPSTPSVCTSRCARCRTASPPIDGPTNENRPATDIASPMSVVVPPIEST